MTEQFTVEPDATPRDPAPFGRYAPATVNSDGMTWVSAQLPVGGGGLDPTTAVSQQTRRALANVVAIGQAAGGTVNSVPKVTLYVTDLAAWGAVDAFDVYGAQRPARTVVQVAGLQGGFRVAADAIACRKQR